MVLKVQSKLMALVMAQPWQPSFNPLFLSCYTTLSTRSRKFFLNYLGDNDQDPENHIRVFNVTFWVLGVVEENVFARLFFESLIGYVAIWFQHLEDRSITRWNLLKDKFLARSKPIVNVISLLFHFFEIQKK